MLLDFPQLKLFVIRGELKQVVTFSQLWICENALGFILAFSILTCLTALNIFLVSFNS